MKKKVRKNPVAKVTIYGLGAMTRKQRMTLHTWLNNVSINIAACGEDYTKGRFTARYFGR